MIDLSVQVDGLRLANPFIVASGPPSTNANVIARAFDEGWGGVVCKTIVLDSTKIVNVSPRYARWRVGDEIVGWENIELISDRPIETWEDEFRTLKKRYPGRVLIASVMEEYRRSAWHEVVERMQRAGADAIELNMSCPHGLPERRMGSAMGQSPELLREVCGWVREVARVPVWAKMTPNVTSIVEVASAAVDAGCAGISAINTILSVMGVDLNTLRPEPTVEGFSTPGGYSGRAVKPIALRMAMEIALATRGRASLSAIGGVEAGEDAPQYILLGASTVQVCTGVMIRGYGLVRELERGLRAFMERHAFRSIEDFRGHSLKYFTSHAGLVARKQRGKPGRDAAWSADRFVEQVREEAE
ncbi:MAG: NAD-dependent dihydropyrimidine dehydrogenase subunit PreA [Phycisphaerales bacterium]|jgi:dihydroorotate dehydrogenase subfamily 1|nr:NAD-dependent dihydropyrimidine dehydrogenase subunit PreA [Phycisphaerales bacterium]